MADRRPRKVKTGFELQAEIDKKRKELLELEQKAYAHDLAEAVKTVNIAQLFADIKSQVDGASDIAILSAIAKAAKIKRIEITQKDPVPRAKRKQTT